MRVGGANEEEGKQSRPGFPSFFQVFFLIVVCKRELMAFADTRCDIQLAESICDTG